MIQKFLNHGYNVADFEDEVDIYIINTCTVTNMADRKSRQELRKVKERNKEAIIVAVRLLCTSFKKHIRKYGRNRFSSWK